ncbi:hypothetical protein GW891_00380, partial [bacterium]|nr:hypothetical protein [bacterium]
NIVKNKGVFGFIIPNIPYFSHTLFTIKPKIHRSFTSMDFLITCFNFCFNLIYNIICFIK